MFEIRSEITNPINTEALYKDTHLFQIQNENTVLQLNVASVSVTLSQKRPRDTHLFELQKRGRANDIQLQALVVCRKLVIHHSLVENGNNNYSMVRLSQKSTQVLILKVEMQFLIRDCFMMSNLSKSTPTPPHQTPPPHPTPPHQTPPPHHRTPEFVSSACQPRPCWPGPPAREVFR